MIFASATGSSGHSLSAGGPILHPTLDCGVLNFLAPRTLAFRPLILPISSSQPIKMGLTRSSKADEVEIHLDGVSSGKLKKHHFLNVKRRVEVFKFSSLGIKGTTSFPCIQFLRNNCRLESSIIEMFKLESTLPKHFKNNKIDIDYI
jgi:NAD kinase